MAKRVLITAGGSGIGHAMATTFASQGAKVWVTDIDQDKIAGIPSNWCGSTVDAADATAVSDLFDQIQTQWNGLDVLCANAGIAGPTAKLEDMNSEDFDNCVRINLSAAFLATKFAAPMMKRQNSGSIIYTSSTAGIHGFPNRAPYCASKWGTHGLMKTAAMELGPFGIRANVVCPGSVEGPRIDSVIEREAAAKGTTPEKIRTGYEAGTSLRSFVTAQDIANMAVFLASDSAKLISGQVISVDGHTENPDPKV